MHSLATLACGNCVYYAMWHRFPPTASWVFIIPGWFLVLSIVRTWSDTKLSLIPRIPIAIMLVVALFFFAPGMIGPPLGFWIPVCCLVGTWTGLRNHWKTPLANKLVAVTVFVAASLVIFGVRDYRHYSQMPTSDKEKFRPIWEQREPQNQTAGSNFTQPERLGETEPTASPIVESQRDQ
ncbi:MAG: hypothetical protein HUJ26_03930 [Planctomycetaceae bacterium]|nr:hypothetical protein [Planctomycetaceae bacterium]